MVIAVGSEGTKSKKGRKQVRQRDTNNCSNGRRIQRVVACEMVAEM